MIHITQAEHDAFKAAVAERDRLLALTTWQPIETAPKDGTAILLGCTGGAWIGKWLPVYGSGYRPENPWSSLMLNHDHMGEKWWRPTHWMPLLAPPKVAPISEVEQEGAAP